MRENCGGIQCDSCLWWFHLECSALSDKEYNYFATTHDLWLCLHCGNEILLTLKKTMSWLSYWSIIPTQIVSALIKFESTMF